jgi:transposase
MGKQDRLTDEFKRDAVAQVVDRGYAVREVAKRLGIITKSIYTWQRLFPGPVKVFQEVDAQADEIRRLKRDLMRVTEAREQSTPSMAAYASPSAGAKAPPLMPGSSWMPSNRQSMTVVR